MVISHMKQEYMIKLLHVEDSQMIKNVCLVGMLSRNIARRKQPHSKYFHPMNII